MTTTNSNNSPNATDSRPTLKVVPPTTNTPPGFIPPPTDQTPSNLPSPTKSDSSLMRKLMLGGLILGLGFVGFMPISPSVNGEAFIESTPEKRQVVTVPKSAFIKKVYVRSNSTVSAGTILVEFQSDELDSQLSTVDRNLSEANSEYLLAQRQYDIALSNQKQASVRYENTRHKATKLQTEIAQDKLPRTHQLENEKIRAQSELAGLQEQLQLLNTQIIRDEKLVNQGGLARKALDEPKRQKIALNTQIQAQKAEVKAREAQIEDARHQQNDQLQEHRQQVDEVGSSWRTTDREVAKADAEIQRWSRQKTKLKAELEVLKKRKENLIFRAKAAGVVIAEDLDVLDNQTLPEGKELLRVVDLTHPSAIAELTQEDAELVRRGMTVNFRLQSGQFNEYKAIVDEEPQHVSVDQTQQKRLVKVRLKFKDDSAAARLMLGTKGYARIQIEQIRIYQNIQREFLKLFPMGKFF